MRSTRWRGTAALAVLAALLPALPAGAVVSSVVRAAPVVVDPVGCRARSSAVVCRPADVAARLRDGGTVVLKRGIHVGQLDLRGRAGVVVRGEPGAVLDAGAGRFALALRAARGVEVRDLRLRGGYAQTVWVDGGTAVVLRRVQVSGGRGAGVQVRGVRGFTLVDSTVRQAASAGIMELTGVRDSRYERLVVDHNGGGAAPYDGDGLQLAGTGVIVRDVRLAANGSSSRYEHGVYVASAARRVELTRLRVTGSSGTAVKLQGSGVLRDSVLVDDATVLYCGRTAVPGWQVLRTTLTGRQRVHRQSDCRLIGV